MIQKMVRSLCLTLAALASLMVLHQTALAGPPLLCHPFEIGHARSLPWNGPEWRSVKADYDISRLVEDTLALLTPETPVLVRMETLRRATIYAVWAVNDYKVGYPTKDLKAANELLSQLTTRARDAHGKGRNEALALFDLGYYVETYKQAAQAPQLSISLRDQDGYASVVKAINIYGSNPEMEFAAAVITSDTRRGAHREHLQKAVARASDGSLLARNLVTHFGDKGKTVAELRSNLGVAKN